MGLFEGIRGQVFSIDVLWISIYLLFFLIFSVVVLAFLASIGLTLLVLGCALSSYNWWPMFVVIFYVFCPVPLAIERRCSASGGYGIDDTNAGTDIAWFITSVIVVSAFALPAVFAHAGVIVGGSTAFIMTANAIIFTTIGIYFMTYGSEDSLSLF